MKGFILSFSALVLLFSFSNCVNGQQLQEKPPKAIQQAFFTTWTGGVKTAGSGFNLFIPVAGDTDIVMDTVYFRGRKAILEKESTSEDLYVGRFKNPSSEHSQALIMHEDPRKEYGNKPPARIEKIPFELAQGEAVVHYTKNGKSKYFRLTGIQKKDSAELKLKNPPNIQH